VLLFIVSTYSILLLNSKELLLYKTRLFVFQRSGLVLLGILPIDSRELGLLPEKVDLTIGEILVPRITASE
jgi:hypothetical protein